MLEARVEPSHGFDMFSAQEEVQAGQQAAAQVAKQLPVLPDSDPVTIYVQRLGQQLAAHAPGEKWPYSFHVVNQKEINAFALPGGPVFVNLGTIQAADNEAELAGVMAHEISHVVQRHGTRAASKQMAAQLPLAILGGVMGQGALSQMAQMGLSFGVGSYFLKNSRKAESEADLLGTDIMYDTGFNPRAMADFFAKLERQGGVRAGPQFLSDHPDPGNRAQAVAKEVATLAQQDQLSQRQRRVSRHQTARCRHEASDRAADRGDAANPGGELLPGERQSSPAAACAASTISDFDDFLSRQLAGVRRPELRGHDRSARAECHRIAVAYGVMINTYQPEDPTPAWIRRLTSCWHRCASPIPICGRSGRMKTSGSMELRESQWT